MRTEGAAKAAVAAMTMLQPDAVDSTRGAVLQEVLQREAGERRVRQHVPRPNHERNTLLV